MYVLLSLVTSTYPISTHMPFTLNILKKRNIDKQLLGLQLEWYLSQDQVWVIRILCYQIEKWKLSFS